MNDLTTGLRPGVWIDEIPWHEMDIDHQLTLICEDSFARQMEQFFRRKLFQWKYFQADMVVEPYYPIEKRFSTTGNGISVKEETIRNDAKNGIASHAYQDALADERNLEKIRLPVVTADGESDQKNLELAEDVLGDILPVRLIGAQVYCTIWDEISTLRGVEPCLYDMVDRPEYMHAIVQKLADCNMSYYSQLEALGLLEPHLSALHSTPAYTSELPQKDFNGKARRKDVWFRGMAQMLSTVSPQMFEEFELHYMRPLMECFGLVYYGCCEPLDNRIELLKTVPNMRKIGASPWANVESCAEQIGSGYVLARKPNPAHVALNFDAQVVEKETEETIRACIRNNCPYEFVLKDISTVSYKPQNLIDWSKTVRETIDRYYGNE